MNKPLLAALAAFASIALLGGALGCDLWWGWQYLQGVRTARGDVSLAVPLPVICIILMAAVVVGGLAARSAFVRASLRTHAQGLPR